MGAVYSVYFEYKVKDEKKLVEAFNEYVHDHIDTTTFNHEDELTNSLDCFKSLFAEHQNDFRIEAIDTGLIGIHSSFSGSYGWHSVMDEVISKLAPYLEDGSEMEIYTWDYDSEVIYEVKNGELVSKNE